MKKTFFASLIAFLCLESAVSQPWQPLFDGKTLKGWHTLPGGRWEVKKGILTGTSDAENKNHGLLITDKTFRDFTVSITYKAIKGNSGLYFRCDEVGGEVGVNGFQAEIDPYKDAGGLYETGGRNWVIQPTADAVKKWFKPGKWNTMQVTARGRDITVYVNGIKSAALTNDPGRLEGHFALQLHGSMDMEVLFKNIKIRQY